MVRWDKYRVKRKVESGGIRDKIGINFKLIGK